MSASGIFLLLCMVLVGAIAISICIGVAALDDWQGDLGSDDLAQLADDMHLAKVARMADAINADRERALDRMADNAHELGLYRERA
jgi:uncharacterized protein YbjQ (UPF0145 family)